MKKMLFLLLIPVCTTLFAQTARPSDFHRLGLEMALQQFDATRNAAGMGLFQPASGSMTQLEAFRQQGDFHLAQTGDADLGFKFSTLRYDSFSDKLFMKGSFYYSFDREKGRKWSDVLDPWFSIPYIYGCAVAKNYDSHDCGLSFDLYTAPLSDVVSLGLKTDYQVSDVSGTRDPRPRTGYLNYQVVPSVLLTFGRHHVGLDLGFGYSKEKLSGLTTIQSYPNLYYYKMSGLDHIDGAIAGYSGFKRQFIGKRFLGDLSYSLTFDAVRVLVSGGAEYLIQRANGDKMQSPGSYNCLTYNGIADVEFLRETWMHKLHLEGTFRDGGADEYLQELTSSKDPVTGATTETWVTLYEYTNRYMLKTWQAALGYTLYGGCSGTDYRWSAALEGGYAGFRKDCHLPHSDFGTSGWNVTAGGSIRLLDRNSHKVDLAVKGGGYLHGNTFLTLQSENIYTEEVLVPDRDYYLRDYVHGSADLTWQFPLNLGKAGWANGYVRLSGGLRKALPEGSLSGVSVAVGLFTF